MMGKAPYSFHFVVQPNRRSAAPSTLTTACSVVCAWALAWLLAAPLAGCGEGCSKAPPERRQVQQLLSRFPRGARIVVSIDVDRVRVSDLWRRLALLAGGADAADRALLDDLTARTGFDPFRDVHRLAAVFPEEARAGGAFGLMVRGESLDPGRLVPYAQEQAGQRGGKLVARTRAGRQLWGVPDGAAGFFSDERTFLLGGGGWADAMADLSAGLGGAGSSAADDPELVRLCERAGVGHAIWAAAVVPEETRRMLLADAGASPDVSSSVMRLAAGLNLGPGLTGSLVAELGSEQDARQLVARVERFLREARQSPQALVLGLGPYLAGVAARQEGPNARVTLALDEGQTQSLADRLARLANFGRSSSRGAIKP